MNVSDKNILIDKLSTYYTDEELAVIIYCLDEGILDLFDICNLDTFEELAMTKEDDIDINRNCVNALYGDNKPNILEDTTCSFISVDNTMYKYDYIVSDDTEDEEKIVKAVLKDYVKYNGFDDFDIDITNYLDEDYFKDWYYEQLVKEARQLAKEPSSIFPNQLYETMFDNGDINDTDFEFDENIGETDYNQPLMDTETLIDIYADDNSDIFLQDIINTYIEEYGETSLMDEVNNGTIEIDWDKLTADCINEDGIETYLSVNNKVGTVEIKDTDYRIYLEHTNA